MLGAPIEFPVFGVVGDLLEYPGSSSVADAFGREALLLTEP
jgi:hypothetical protein